MTRIVFLLVILCCVATGLKAQDTKNEVKKDEPSKEDTLLPFQKYPTLPAFNIMMMDSVTIFNTYNIPEGKPIAIMFFDPGCKHCKFTMSALIAGMDSIKNIQFYLVTPMHSMTELRGFYDKYRLGNYKNIQVVGRDFEFFFFSFYGAKFLPDIALYDEHKKLVKLIRGDTNASAVYQAFHQ
jgi:thiol-disulfide isomerase/thioredoxin